MASEHPEAYVWAWLPGATDPVVAGRLRDIGTTVTFTYGLSYLELAEAVPLYLPELPLSRGPMSPTRRHGSKPATPSPPRSSELSYAARLSEAPARRPSSTTKAAS